MDEIKKNVKYIFIEKFIAILIPLITVPYISRVLGPEGNGIYSYTYTIATYFLMFAMLGTSNYGSRKVAKARDNKELLSKEVSSIYIMQIITSIIVLTIYVAYILNANLQNKEVYILQIVYIVSALFDVSWYFGGIENFKKISKINIAIKILTTICLFMFVKTKENVCSYTLIASLNILLSQVILWMGIRKEIYFIKPKYKEVIEHLKKSLILFIPIISININKMAGKVIIGNICGMKEVGYYTYAQKIIEVPETLILIIGTVMLPHMSNLVSKNNEKKVREYLNKTIELLMFLTIPMAIGLFTVGESVAPVILGNNYIETGKLLKYLSITLIIFPINNIIRTQYLIPKEKDREFISVLIFSAIINIFLNYVLISKYNTIGAVIAIILTEGIVFALQIVCVKEVLNNKILLKRFGKFLISGSILYIIMILLNQIINNKLIGLIVQVLVGSSVYILINYKYVKKLLQL